MAQNPDMAQVFISIGSNIQRSKYIAAGIRQLNSLYSPIKCSTVYESEAVGFDGDNFYNLVVAFDTTQSISEVSAHLSRIEDENGRNRAGPRFSSRTLDLDLLLYDGQIINDGNLILPRPEIYENAFVLLPLSEVGGDIVDPIKHITYRQMWHEFNQSKQKLWPVAFDIPL